MSADKSEIFAYYWRIIEPDAPQPIPEFHFDMHLGRRHRFDWAFVAEKIAVEIDGGQWSARGGRHASDTDREKLNIAAMLGWRVFRFSPDQLKRDPDDCVRMVRHALMRANDR